MTGREVWVTGIGAVSAAGLGASALGGLLSRAASGVRRLGDLGGLPAARTPTPAGGKLGKRLDRSALMMFAAGEEAWRDAALDEAGLDPRRCAIIEGSSLGPLAAILTEQADRLGGARHPAHPASRIVRFMTGAGGAALAQAHGLRGPVFHLSAGSVSAACAIGEGFQRVAAGLADVVIAGGAECPLHPDILDSFAAAGLLAPPHEEGSDCRPFDARRNGTVLGEGAGALILESADHARRRGALPRALLSGFGLSCEAYSMTAPEPAGGGIVDAVTQALDGTNGEIGWIKAHGTGTRVNDAAECRGLATLFGPDLPGMPITSLKPALGHALGASGAVEMVGAILALEGGFIPATFGTAEIDRELPCCTVVTSPQSSAARRILVLAESFGGRCAALVLDAGHR
ncbi:MAG: beta-ketoacyl-[acyl-carrier-protein] synthase family protein [Gemmatimonadales bacterium]